MNNNSDTYRYSIKGEQVGERIDKALSALNDDLSRARVQALMEQGQVILNGLPCKTASKKLVAGDLIKIIIPQAVAANPQAQDIPLDVLYEDEDVIVINKQSGLVVHPGAGNHDGTLVNALLHHCGDSLSGIGGVMRPGIVHRLDKETTGVMIAAKNDKAHKGLAAQLEDRSLSRIYKALVLGVPTPLKGRINHPLARHHVYRQKMAVNRRNGKDAATRYLVLERYKGACSLVQCSLETGRTHQIRVHMEANKHQLIGDPVYGAQQTATISVFKKAGYDQSVIDQILAFPRQALHAQTLSFIHPRTEETMSFDAPLADDFDKLLKLL